MTNKLYEIVFSFLEPTQAVATIEATSEEDAVNKIRYEMDGRVEQLRILNIKEVLVLPEGVSSEDLSTDKTIN